jgi:hypothetical protein
MSLWESTVKPAESFRPDNPIAEDVMGIDDRAHIPQSMMALLVLEKRLRGRPVADRVTLLRLLKAGTTRSLRAAAAVLGCSERPRQRWWAIYTTRGLEALVQ